MWWTSLAAALAAPDGPPPRGARGGCEPLEEAEFRSFVLDAQSAIDRGDIDLPVNILDELDARLPCLAFAVQPRMWADLLVARAIVDFTRGGPWEQAMAAALRIRPAIDRGVGSSHPLASWEPPSEPPTGPPVPDGARLYIDGMLSPVLPPDRGLYLVQKTDGRFWNTLVLLDTPLPEGWASSPVDQPPRVASWGRGGVVLGGGNVVQDSNWGSDWYVDVPAADTAAVLVGLAGDLQVTFFSPFGVLAQGAVRYLPLSPGLDARASAAWAWRGLTLGAGAGVASIDTYEEVEDELVHRWRLLRYPQATALIRARRGLRWDLALTAGGGASVQAYDVGVGVLLGGRVRVALEASGRAGRFFEEGFPDRALATDAARASLRFDLVRGEY